MKILYYAQKYIEWNIWNIELNKLKLIISY